MFLCLTAWASPRVSTARGPLGTRLNEKTIAEVLCLAVAAVSKLR